MTEEEIQEAAKDSEKETGADEVTDESWKDDAAQVLEEYTNEDDAPAAPETDAANDAPVETPTAEGADPVQDVRDLVEFYKDADLTNAKEVRDTFLRKTNELAEQRKAFEAEREQVTGRTQQEAQAWATDPVRTGLSKLYESLAPSLHPQQQQQLGAMLTEFGQILQSDGLFNPQQLQAQAQQQQLQQQQTQYQQAERVTKAKEGFWAFQSQIGKVLSEPEKAELMRSIEFNYAQTGQLLSYQDAWQKLAQQKAAVVKPVATVSPAKRGQQLRRTAERGTASSSASGGDDVLDLAAQVLAEYRTA